jgi:hypothetical protein
MLPSRSLFRLLALVAVALSVAHAESAQAASDPVFIDFGARGVAQEPLKDGTIFGSIGFAPPSAEIHSMSVHLVPLEPGLHKVELFAANRPTHPKWRPPDIDTADARIWAFSGTVPQGHYLIRIAGMAPGDGRKVIWMELSPALELIVKAGAAVYIGRWQFTAPDVEVPEPKVRAPGHPLVLRDTLDVDRALLRRRELAVPDDIDDAPKALMGPRI